jgi:drug/metabolite transporter (DMT)-like permease
MLYIGEIAAIITSITFAINSTLFTLAGRQVGSIVVNRLRLAAASLLLLIAHWILLGSPWPVEAGFDRWFWLGLSGIVGLVLGDALLFQSFVLVGPRLAMLMMSLAPVMSALLAWIFLEEYLKLAQIAGILVTLLGVVWVVIEKNSAKVVDQGQYTKGILMGFGGAVGQAVGFVMAKIGLTEGFSPISGNYIRMVTAMVLIWLITLFRREFSRTISEGIKNPAAVLKIAAGAFSGPFLGVSLSLFALQHTSVGVASTLMALPPLFLLPVDYYYFKERFGWGAIAGTALALIGVGILFIV